ncbi:hypothetical protein ACFLS8_00550 [Chloroflexota bacterium]
MPGEYRLLTLTTPQYFGGVIHDAWRKFLKRMRRRGLIREYYTVKEWNKAHTCQHPHVVLRLDYIGYQVACQQWQAVTGAVWIHVGRVRSLKGMACYLGKYLNKAYYDEPGKLLTGTPTNGFTASGERLVKKCLSLVSQSQPASMS